MSAESFAPASKSCCIIDGMDNDERNTPPAAAQDPEPTRRVKNLSLDIYRRGAKRDRGWSNVSLYQLSVESEAAEDKDLLVLSSPSEVTFSGKAPHHSYEIAMPMETARAIVEAYCNKLSDSPEIAVEDEQLRSLAPALVRLLSTIIR